MIPFSNSCSDIIPAGLSLKDNVLNKKDKLNPSEWQIMKSHPEIGFNILKKANSLKEISHIVLHHHEKWDGSGYPSGLNKEEIPLGSRQYVILLML